MREDDNTTKEILPSERGVPAGHMDVKVWCVENTAQARACAGAQAHQLTCAEACAEASNRKGLKVRFHPALIGIQISSQAGTP